MNHRIAGNFTFFSEWGNGVHGGSFQPEYAVIYTASLRPVNGHRSTENRNNNA